MEKNQEKKREKIAKEMKITVYTNNPNGIEYEKTLLTLAILYRPGVQGNKKLKTNTNPFFSYRVKYKESSLNWMEYEKILKSFFDKNDFEYVFGSDDLLPENADDYAKMMTDELSGSKYEFFKREYYEKRTENIDNNVMLMIKYLLPTKFPVVNNHFSTYDLLRGKDSMSSFFFNPTKQRNLVYFKLPSGNFTVVKVSWLSDVMNNPYYSMYIDDDAKDVPPKKNGQSQSSNLTLAEFMKTRPEYDQFEDIRKCYESTCKSEFQDKQYCGIEIIGEGGPTETYELVLDTELIETEIKDTEIDNVKCSYFGDYLGEELIRLLKIAKGKRRFTRGKLVKHPIFSPVTKLSKRLGYLEKEEVNEKMKEKRRLDEEEYNEIEIGERENYEQFIKTFLPQMLTRFRTKIKKYDITKQSFFVFLKENFRPLIKFIKDKKYTNKDSEDIIKKTEEELVSAKKELDSANTKLKEVTDESELSATDKDAKQKEARQKVSKAKEKVEKATINNQEAKQRKELEEKLSVDQIPMELKNYRGEVRQTLQGRQIEQSILKYIETRIEEFSDSKNKKYMTKEAFDEIRFKYDLTEEFVRFLKNEYGKEKKQIKKGGRTNKYRKPSNRTPSNRTLSNRYTKK